MGVPRKECPACRRPRVVCYCAHIVPIETRTRVVMVQHRKERDMPIGTLRMAELALPNSAVYVGVDGLDDDPRLQAELARPNTYLLFPGPDAIDVNDLAVLHSEGDAPLTLVVVDGTWWQARSLLRRNPSLAALPQIRFTPPRPSDYRIRKEPADHCVSTVEAIAYLLGALEGGFPRFEPLLAPFRAMVDTQLQYVAERRGGPSRHAASREKRAARPTLDAKLRARLDDLVCIHAEANAWPTADGKRHDAELIHWCAVRPGSDERFESVLAPRQPLSPATLRHTLLDEAWFAGGESLEAMKARWQAFLRPTDVLVTWGGFAVGLANQDGIPLPAERLDLRHATTRLAGARPGGQEAWLARRGVPEPPAMGAGRAGERVAQLVATTRDLAKSP
jgi:DTW domain-containing protein YfiP